MRLLLSLSIAAALQAPGRAVAAPATTAAGEVVRTQARWRGDRIVTEATLRLDGGGEITFAQPGGTVDGIGMRVLPGPAPLRTGDRVEVELAPAGSGRLPWLRRARTLAVASVAPPGEPPDQLGYVRTTNVLGTPLAWASGCVFIAYDEAGTSHIPGDGERAVMDGVFARWRADTDQCSYLQFDIDPPAPLETRFDRVNVIKFREDRWCRPAQGGEPEECYNPDAAALTTLFFVEDEQSDRDGEILDADIEMNAVHFAISVAGETEGTAACMSDLAATLTHEVGHLMGLDHTCWTGVGDQPVDDQGDPVPLCSPDLPASLREATMYNFQECGELIKASPEADDIQGVCDTYPLAEDPGTCERVSATTRGCCSTGGGGGGTLLLAGLTVLLARRRRSRRPD